MASHRAENVDDRFRLEEIIEGLGLMKKELKAMVGKILLQWGLRKIIVELAT